MSTVHPCLPTNPFRMSGRKHSARCSPLTSRTNCTSSSGDARHPRNMQNVSITHLREAITSLDKKMASLMRQRQELESHLEQAVRLQSPVSRVPSELLSSIFIMGVLGTGDENPVMVSTLMLVCRYWSEVALSTPNLWANISVSPHDSLEKARRKLERSKSCPIDVTINFSPRLEYAGSVTGQIIQAMDLLRPALWRTKSFYLGVPNRPQAHIALLRCQEDAPLLETLSIHIFHSMQDDHYSTPPIPLFKGNTPRLHSCSFTSFNFGWDHRLVSRLRVLKLSGYFNAYTPSANTLLEILRQCPDLEELALRNMSSVDSEACAPRSKEPDPSGPLCKSVQLRKLTKVTFYYAGNALTRQIMSHISFPNLEILEMSYLENVTPVLHLLYTQALTRLPLRHLRIETCLLNELKFVNLLRRLPSLVTLELVDVEDVSPILLKGLSSSQPWVCPRLESFTIDGCTGLDWDSLRSFVESRLPANPHAYAKFHSTPKSISSTASAAAAAFIRSKALQPYHNAHSHVMQGPERLRVVDVTRCNQINKEMVQWLRMYVAHVKCEPAKGAWGEPVMP